MPIYQRSNGIWYCDIAHGEKRIRRSLGTADRAEAEQAHDKIKHELWRTATLGERPRKTWDEAALRWLDEMAHKADIVKDAAKIRDLKKLRGLVLEHISRDVVLQAVKTFGSTNSTKNRYLALIRAILRKAHREWDWLEKCPAITLYPEPKRRIRWLTKDEAFRLVAALPPHLADAATFALATGLRQANLLGLEWSQVDMQRRVAWIHPDQAKAGRAIGVPLNQTAIDVLRRQIGKHHQYVFTYRQQRINWINSRTWARALGTAGIKDFRWHDLRHTWASWLVQAGTPLAALQEMGGWETPQMVQRYAHLSTEHLHGHASAIDTLMANDTNPTQESGKGKRRKEAANL